MAELDAGSRGVVTLVIAETLERLAHFTLAAGLLSIVARELPEGHGDLLFGVGH